MCLNKTALQPKFKNNKLVTMACDDSGLEHSLNCAKGHKKEARDETRKLVDTSATVIEAKQMYLSTILAL